MSMLITGPTYSPSTGIDYIEPLYNGCFLLVVIVFRALDNGS